MQIQEMQLKHVQIEQECDKVNVLTGKRQVEPEAEPQLKVILCQG
jgi:hypothetical protein